MAKRKVKAVEEWPVCGCGMEYPPRRHELGYRTCLDCGSPPVNLWIVEVPKSNPMVVRPGTDIRGIASSHKGNRQ